jgi:hypothetical protein
LGSRRSKLGCRSNTAAGPPNPPPLIKPASPAPRNPSPPPSLPLPTRVAASSSSGGSHRLPHLSGSPPSRSAPPPSLPPADPLLPPPPGRRRSRAAPLLPPPLAPNLVVRSSGGARRGGGRSGPRVPRRPVGAPRRLRWCDIDDPAAQLRPGSGGGGGSRRSNAPGPPLSLFVCMYVRRPVASSPALADPGSGGVWWGWRALVVAWWPLRLPSLSLCVWCAAVVTCGGGGVGLSVLVVVVVLVLVAGAAAAAAVLGSGWW